MLDRTVGGWISNTRPGTWLHEGSVKANIYSSNTKNLQDPNKEDKKILKWNYLKQMQKLQKKYTVGEEHERNSF